jgi:ElaB/YqjD/DUF883 family membrane-anchored ribosome-binding protein
MEKTIAEDQMDALVDEIADLFSDQTDMANWTQESRKAYQNEVLRRVRNELDSREELGA